MAKNSQKINWRTRKPQLVKIPSEIETPLKSVTGIMCPPWFELVFLFCRIPWGRGSSGPPGPPPSSYTPDSGNYIVPIPSTALSKKDRTLSEVSCVSKNSAAICLKLIFQAWLQRSRGYMAKYFSTYSFFVCKTYLCNRNYLLTTTVKMKHNTIVSSAKKKQLVKKKESGCLKIVISSVVFLRITIFCQQR